MKAPFVFAFVSAIIVHAQPSIVPGGVLNSASFAKNSSGQGTPVAPGSLVTIFGSGLGATGADADTVPFSTSLGGVTVTFNNIPAPLAEVIPAAGIVNAQVPFEAMQAGQGSAQVNMVVTFNNQSASQTVTLVPSAPGVFTLPEGVGYAVLVNLSDGSIAAPPPTVPGFTLTSHPISRGQSAFFYATGLGAMTPSVADGAASPADPTKNAFVNTQPIVWIGGVNTGVMAPIIFAGQAPGYPGVYQVNIMIPANAPTGNNIPLQLQSADGLQTSPTAAVIAIQ
jgi:minor extracellular serine protease Vpr